MAGARGGVVRGLRKCLEAAAANTWHLIQTGGPQELHEHGRSR
jgi:hypothetical protein